MVNTGKVRSRRNKGVVMVEYAILTGSVSLVGMLCLSVVGRKVSGVFSTLAVVLPGAQMSEDRLAPVTQFIEVTNGEDDTYRIDASHIGNGDTSRLNRAVALQSGDNDSSEVVHGL